jgi:hypothetical protein
MEPVMRNAHMGILKFAFWWLPTLRWFGEYAGACEKGRVKELHCRGGEKTYTRGETHLSFLPSILNFGLSCLRDEVELMVCEQIHIVTTWNISKVSYHQRNFSFTA